MDGGVRLAVLEGDSVEALAEELARTQREYGDRLQKAVSLQVHLWHTQAWWSLSDDLSQFCTWIIDARMASFDETCVFVAAPLSRPEWLFEAARQMKQLLEAATKRPVVDGQICSCGFSKERPEDREPLLAPEDKVV